MRVSSLWFLLLTSPLVGQNMRWTRGHTLGAAVSTSAIAADCLQTANALRHGAREMNPFLGSHPTQGQLTTMCLVGGATNLFVGWVLPAKARRWWFWSIAGIEVTAFLVSRH